MTDRYAAFGNPMGHAKSPFIHGLFARQTGEDIRYDAIEAPVAGFRSAVDDFRKIGGRGINVTVPFKIEACGYATTLSERARIAGAVNCLRFNGDSIEGENFDGIGLVQDLRRNLGIDIAGRRVLVLGAGGAARGLLQPLLEQQVVEVVVAARSAVRAAELERALSMIGNVHGMGFAELDQAGRFDLVLNATTASMQRRPVMIPTTVFGANALAYDLFYGTPNTPFLELARPVRGVRLATGLGMLVEQAAESFAWWRGVRPRTGPVIAALRDLIEAGER